MNALLIINSKFFRKLLKDIFEKHGFTALFADSFIDAFGYFDAQKINIICTEYHLIDSDKDIIVSLIRNQTKGTNVPILLLTSKDKDISKQSLSSGVTEVFRKDEESIAELERYIQAFRVFKENSISNSATILLTGTNEYLVDSINNYFKESQIRFVYCCSTEDAEALVRAAEFDLIITMTSSNDWLTSASFVRKIKSINKQTSRIPILTVAERLYRAQKLELLIAGIRDIIIIKSSHIEEYNVLMEELDVRIQTLLTEKRLFEKIEAQKQQLEALTVRDHLTGLYNRLFLSETAPKLIGQAYRANPQTDLSLLVIDLDFFKNVNDTYGHATGDKVLIAVAALIINIFRDTDVPVRFGGEEFVVLLPQCSSSDALKRADYFRRRLETTMPAGLHVTASIGVSSLPSDHQTDYETLFKHADNAVYESKAKGRNCSTFHPVEPNFTAPAPI